MPLRLEGRNSDIKCRDICGKREITQQHAGKSATKSAKKKKKLAYTVYGQNEESRFR